MAIPRNRKKERLQKIRAAVFLLSISIALLYGVYGFISKAFTNVAETASIQLSDAAPAPGATD